MRKLDAIYDGCQVFRADLHVKIERGYLGMLEGVVHQHAHHADRFAAKLHEAITGRYIVKPDRAMIPGRYLGGISDRMFGRQRASHQAGSHHGRLKEHRGIKPIDRHLAVERPLPGIVETIDRYLQWDRFCHSAYLSEYPFRLIGS